MAGADADVDVLIVGGGPVGLTARALLDRWGVRTLLVEKRRELSPFPRSRLVNVRSMEIFRGLGIAGAVTARAFAPEYGRVRFRDTLCGRDFATAAMVGINAPIPESPVIGVVTSQDRLEPVLLAAADSPARFGVELVDLTGGRESVTALLVDGETGAGTRVRARYVIAADGANSFVRQRLGIGTAGPGVLRDTATVVFDADLDRWCAASPAGAYFTSHGSFVPLYPEGGWAWFVPDVADDPDWTALVSAALGADVPVKVDRVQHWPVNAFVAERFRAGRLLLAGDAAHAIPPAGGLGMNVGLADVHNLCWKLAGVLHGWAGSGLLETYESERRPVAHQALEQAVANARLMYHAQARRREQRESGGTPDRIELPWSERYFAQLGFVLGVNYRSAAVVGGDEEPSEVDTDYVPATRPGHRMPHLRLDRERSTLDAFGEWFTLLAAAPAHWKQAVAPWPLRVETLSEEHADRCGLGPDGALLVRPDGHIGASWPGGSPDALRGALAAITGGAPWESGQRTQ